MVVQRSCAEVHVPIRLALAIRSRHHGPVRDRIPTLTPEQHAAMMRDLSSRPGERAELFLELANKLAEMASDTTVDEETRQRATARLDAAWLVLSGAESGDKERRRLLLAAAVKSAANAPPQSTIAERAEQVMIVFGSMFPEDAACLRPAHVVGAIQRWHAKRGEEPTRWDAMLPLYDDIGCAVTTTAAKNEWDTRPR
jgi:hypothetical protein